MAGSMNDHGLAEEDGFEDCDEMWDQRSDFSNLSQSGYRNAILGDFDEAQKEGRVAGFSKACEKNNPTFILARLDGCLTACLLFLKDTLSEEQRTEACSLQAEISSILASATNPNWELLQEFCENGQSLCSESNVRTEAQNIGILARTKEFCDRVGWKLPTFLVTE